MFDLVWQYIHWPQSGAEWSTFAVVVYAVIGDLLPYSKKFAPNGTAQAVAQFAVAGWKAIKVDGKAGTLTVDIRALEAAYGHPSSVLVETVEKSGGEANVASPAVVTVVSSDSGQLSGVATVTTTTSDLSYPSGGG